MHLSRVKVSVLGWPSLVLDLCSLYILSCYTLLLIIFCVSVPSVLHICKTQGPCKTLHKRGLGLGTDAGRTYSVNQKLE